MLVRERNSKRIRYRKLAREGLIEWVDYYESTVIDNKPTPRKRLIFVAEHKSQLRKIDNKEI